MARFALVLTDNVLYKNDFIEALLDECGEHIPLVIELCFRHPATDRKKHYSRYIRLLGIDGILCVGILAVLRTIQSSLAGVLGLKRGGTLKQITERYGVVHRTVSSVNSDEFRKLLKEFDIDYVFNSANQIYREETLKAYDNRILNRHTSCLPEYGGIYPIFWQMIHRYPHGGVTLHWVDKEIDRGTIAYQEPMEVNFKKSLFWHYKVAFEISLALFRQAIQDLNSCTVASTPATKEPSYFSWPKPSDVAEFRKSYRIAHFEDLIAGLRPLDRNYVLRSSATENRIANAQ